MESQYTLKGITFKNFTEQIDEFWVELMNDPSSREWAKNQGVEIDKVEKMDRAEAIALQRVEEGAGLDADTIEIVVKFVAPVVPVVAKIIKDLWDKVMLPKIEEKFGYKTIEPSQKKTD